MRILVAHYLKVKRRNSLGKLYYKWILVWKVKLNVKYKN